MAASLSIVCARSFNLNTPIKESFLFADIVDAKEAFDNLTQAIKDYDDRKNDSEKFYTFKYLMGEVTVTVSEISFVEIEDPFGEHEDVLREWNRKIGEMRTLACVRTD